MNKHAVELISVNSEFSVQFQKPTESHGSAPVIIYDNEFRASEAEFHFDPGCLA